MPHHTLQTLLSGIGRTAFGACDQRVGVALTDNSREAKPGCIFVARQGATVDSHAFIPQAVAAGAIAVVCERLPENPDPNVCWTVVQDASYALGLLASRWYGEPSKHLKLVGVTGTNGKTTIATLIYDMARLMGQKAGLISTVANKIDDEAHVAVQTTPGPMEINSLLARMVEAGCKVCAMEVSSHASHQKRIAGLEYAGAIFTNLTRDHLDYHKTMAAYLAAKKSFFDGLPKEAWALSNADDKNGDVMLQNTCARKFTYALKSLASFNGKIIEDRLDGMALSLQGTPNGSLGSPTEIDTRFTGQFNAYNLTAVYGASLLLGYERNDVLVALSQLHPVAGRMQTLHGRGGVTAIVDYAHTPDAIANVLQAIARCSSGKIITVVGAGGDRDAGKRPLMAAQAVAGSDQVIITSDNPRHEDAADIASQMLAGVNEADRDAVLVILDRREAIKRAISMACPGDAVLIAGKGHENYQIIGDERHHFDDCEEARLCLDQI